jgi:hypothetical protein
MNAKNILAAAALAVTCVAPSLAHADVVEHLTMNFTSGATFSGNVTMADDFSHYTAVTGTLSGGGYGTDSFGWIWNSYNFSSGPQNYSDFLMDNSGGNWIQLAINYSNPQHLTFTTGVSYGATDNYIDYRDAMVSGSIRNLSAVPEADSFAMLLLGLGVVGAFARKSRARVARA